MNVTDRTGQIARSPLKALWGLVVVGVGVEDMKFEVLVMGVIFLCVLWALSNVLSKCGVGGVLVWVSTLSWKGDSFLEILTSI